MSRNAFFAKTLHSIATVGLLGVAFGSLVGCSPSLSEEEFGQIHYRLPKIEGTETRYSLPPQMQAKSALSGNPTGEPTSSTTTNATELQAESSPETPAAELPAATTPATEEFNEPAGTPPTAVTPSAETESEKSTVP